jgi:hypothetical protein
MHVFIKRNEIPHNGGAGVFSGVPISTGIVVEGNSENGNYGPMFPITEMLKQRFNERVNQACIKVGDGTPTL